MKNFLVANNEVKTLVFHPSGSKRKSRLLLEEFHSDKIDQPSSQESSSKISLKKFSVNMAVTDAAIYWELDVVQNHYSLNSCCNNRSLFIRMFRVSKIAELFSCGSAKCSYIINFGIGSYFNLCLTKPSRKPHTLCVHLMNHITAQLKSDKWTWSLCKHCLNKILQQRAFWKIPIMCKVTWYKKND